MEMIFSTWGTCGVVTQLMLRAFLAWPREWPAQVVRSGGSRHDYRAAAPWQTVGACSGLWPGALIILFSPPSQIPLGVPQASPPWLPSPMGPLEAWAAPHSVSAGGGPAGRLASRCGAWWSGSVCVGGGSPAVCRRGGVWGCGWPMALCLLPLPRLRRRLCPERKPRGPSSLRLPPRPMGPPAPQSSGLSCLGPAP